MAELLREHLLRVDPHGLLGLHAALTHRRRRNRAARERIHKLLVADAAIAIVIALAKEQVELVVIDRNVPQVEGA